MDRPSEDDLIARYFAPLAGEAGLNLKDDAALFAPTPECELVLTTDAVIAGIHFFPDDPPSSIARKALGVNLSDLAAKGAVPRGFLLSLALPVDWTDSWLASFAAGLGHAARDWDCPLMGGDTVRTSGLLTLSITALGEVPTGRMVRRATARIGDAICVTGTIGDAALGLALRHSPDWADSLSPAERIHLADRYLHPQPRHRLAAALREFATAAMDVSDGLAGDLAKMLRAGSASGVVDLAQIPLSAAARRAVGSMPALIDTVVTGGDDYEILCTLSPSRLDDFRKEADRIGIPVAIIGEVVPGEDQPVFRQGSSERRFQAGSYAHF